MRVLAVALACLACSGHGRRAQGPENLPGLSGQISTPSAKAKLRSLLRLRGASSVSRSLASLLRLRGASRVDLEPILRLRGGKSGFDEKRGGFVQGSTLPRTPSRSRGALPTTAATFEVEDTRRKEFASPIGATDESYAAPQLPDRSDTVLVQGGSLKTWSYRSALVDRVQVVLTTDGRPLDADVSLWQGPDNVPCKIRVYSEDGSTRPFRAVIATPYSAANTVAIRNVGQIEFPLAANVISNAVDEPVSDFSDTSMIVQGGALRTFNFDSSVESVEVMLRTDGRPMNARIELLQGPNNNKQVIELYTEDGLERPFFAIIDTMGSGNVVRVVNTAPMEFPMTASVQPRTFNDRMSPLDPIILGGK